MCDSINQVAGQILSRLKQADEQIVLGHLVEGVKFYRVKMAQARTGHAVQTSSPFYPTGRECDLSGLADISASVGGWIERAIAPFAAGYCWDSWLPVPVVRRDQLERYGAEGYAAAAFFNENGSWRVRFSYDTHNGLGDWNGAHRLVYHPVNAQVVRADGPNIGPPAFNELLNHYGLAYAIPDVLLKLAEQEAQDANAVKLTDNLRAAYRQIREDAREKLERWEMAWDKWVKSPFSQGSRDLAPTVNPDREEAMYC